MNFKWDLKENQIKDLNNYPINELIKLFEDFGMVVDINDGKITGVVFQDYEKKGFESYEEKPDTEHSELFYIVRDILDDVYGRLANYETICETMTSYLSTLLYEQGKEIDEIRECLFSFGLTEEKVDKAIEDLQSYINKENGDFINEDFTTDLGLE